MDSEQDESTAQHPFLPNNQETAQISHRRKFLKKPIFWIAIIFLVFVLVTIISLVLYSTIYEDEDEKHFKSSPTNKTCTFTGILNLTDPCLWDVWVQNERTFQDRINNVYEKSPSLQYYFIDANIDYNSTNENKSAIITLEFSSPSKTSENFISTELVEGILRQDINDQDQSTCPYSKALVDVFKVFH